MTKIYTLTDPITNQIRYVGKTNRSLHARLCCHLITKERNHRANWIKGLIKKGKKPIIEIIEECDDATWKIYEKYWISQFKTWGFNLVNATEGGEGGIISDKCRKACIARNKLGFPDRIYPPISEEMKKRISEKLKGRKLSKECLEKRSKTITGRKLTKEHIQKIRVANSKFLIHQYDLKGNKLNTFNSITEAAEKTNSQISKISLVCSGKRNKHNKCIWRSEIKI